MLTLHDGDNSSPAQGIEAPSSVSRTSGCREADNVSLRAGTGWFKE